MSNNRVSALQEAHLLRNAIISLHLVANRAATGQEPSGRDKIVAMDLAKQIVAGLAQPDDQRHVLSEGSSHRLSDFSQLHSLLWWVANTMMDLPAAQFVPAEAELLFRLANPDNDEVFPLLAQRLQAFARHETCDVDGVSNTEWFKLFVAVSGNALRMVSLKRHRSREDDSLAS